MVLKRSWQTSVPLTLTGLLMLVALAASIVGLALDSRIITGAPAWLKPAKFAISVAIYVVTLTWIFTLIPTWTKTRRIVGWFTAIVMVLELTIINLQAWRGTTSHFNVSTPWNAGMFFIMGAAIILQTLTSVTVAIALWKQQFEDRALGWALRLGMTLTIIGAFAGGLMTRPTSGQLEAARTGQPMLIVGAHTVGAPDGGRGIPGTGWSTEHGDLRIPHFIGLHALQILGLIAVVMRRRKVRPSVSVRLTVIAAASYFTLFLILMTQALRGESLFTANPQTLTVLGVWALLTAVCVRMSVTWRRESPSFQAI